MTRGHSETEAQKEILLRGKIQRRAFFQYAGMAMIATTAISCKEAVPEPSSPYVNTDYTIDLKNDTGLMNYIYVLEQLEAAFYTKAAQNLAAGFSPAQSVFFTDIKWHEIAHAEFFKTLLGPAGIATLEFDFSSIDFSNVTAVLTTAKTLEDLGLAAYNGAIEKAKESYCLIILSQIVSVEARHAAWIATQLEPSSFANLTELNALGADAAKGLDVALSPDKVLAQVGKYIKTKLNVINL
jgi:hypothetical protein